MYHLFLRFTRRCLPAGAFVFAFAVGLPSAFAAVQINEISYNPPGTDANHEWVEVVNTGSSSVDLSSWKFYQAGNHTLSSYQGSLSIPANGYAVLTGSGAVFMADHPGFSGVVVKTSFSLSNSGEELRMVDGSNATVDTVAYSTSFANGNGFTLERNASGAWVQSADVGGTPGEQNGSVTATPEPSPSPTPTATPSPPPTPTPSPSVGPGDVLINEFLATPAMGQNEWIELYNFSGHAIDLSLLTIEDATGAPQALSGTLPAGSYVLLDPSPVSLNNSGDTLILRRASDGIPIDQVSYGSAGSGNVLSSTGRSIGAYPDSSATGSGRTLHAFSTPTKGVFNQVNNHAPTAVITVQSPFDVSGTAPFPLNVTGESSSDPDGDTLSYLWEYGDGTVNTAENPLAKEYSTPGTFFLRLTVTDPWGASSLATQSITVTPRGSGGGSASSTTISTPTCSSRVSTAKVTINEILPNPTGSDATGEFIELYNDEPLPVNICGWSLDDGEGGSAPHTFASDTFILARGYHTFFINETGLTLNNDKDAVRLFNPEGKEVSSIEYPESREGQSLSRLVETGKDVWKWTTPSPDRQNILPPQVDGEDLEPSFASDVRISEILPDPAGMDRAGEFIEVENVGEALSLRGFQLRLGTSRFTLEDDRILESGAFLALPFSQTKLALVNAGGTLELADPSGRVVDRISYGQALEGHSFSRLSSDWGWTVPTPGEANKDEPPVGGPDWDDRAAFSVRLKQGKNLLYLQGRTLPNADVSLKLFLLDAVGTPAYEEPDLELTARSSMRRGSFSVALQVALDPGTYRILSLIVPPDEASFTDDTQTVSIAPDAIQATPKTLRPRRRAMAKKPAQRTKTVASAPRSASEVPSGEGEDRPYIGGTTAEDAVAGESPAKAVAYSALLLFTLTGLATILWGKRRS